MFQILSIAVRSLAQHRRRALLLGGAIVVATALLVLMQGLSAGIRETMLRSATTLTTGHINVGGFFKVTPGIGGPLVIGYRKILDIVQREVPELDYVVARRRGWGKLISDRGSIQAGLAGIDIRNEPGFRNVLHVQEGNLDDLAQPNTIMMFAGQAKKLEVTVNDIITVSAQTSRGTQQHRRCARGGDLQRPRTHEPVFRFPQPRKPCAPCISSPPIPRGH